MRQKIRQASRLADEMNAHSFRVHADGTVTWTRWREEPPPQAEQRKKAVQPHEAGASGSASQKNGKPKRAEKKAERARKHHELTEKAVRFRCASAFRCWLRQTAPAKGASAAPQTNLCDTGDGVPGAGALRGTRDSATPSTARPQAAAAPMGSQELIVRPVPAGGLAGCGSPTTGGEGPPGARPQPMHVSPHACLHSGAGNVASQPPHALSTPIASGGACGPPMAMPIACQQRDPNQCIMRLREQHFVPFMQFHVQQGVPEHAARNMWDEYERNQLNEYMSQVT